MSTPVIETTNAPAAAAPPAAPAAPPAAATPPAAPPSAPAPWYVNDGLGLDQDARDYIAGKNFATPGDAVKAMRQFETLARDRNAMEAPVAGKEAEWGGWEKLGWVQDVAKYAVAAPQMPEGVSFPEGLAAKMTAAMHGARVPMPAAKAVMDALGAEIAAGQQAVLAADQARVAEDMAKLKAEWGQNYDANVERAKRTVRAFTTDKEVIDALDDMVGFAPLTRLFAKIGADLGEDRLVTAAGSGAAQHPATARAERLQLEADPAFMASLTDSRHPLHRQNTERRARLLASEAGGRA